MSWGHFLPKEGKVLERDKFKCGSLNVNIICRQKGHFYRASSQCTLSPCHK